MNISLMFFCEKLKRKFHLVLMPMSANGFSYKWDTWTASMMVSVMPEMIMCLERLRWWYNQITHFGYSSFVTLNLTSTLTSWAATPPFNCWRTFSAYRSWYLSVINHLALLFTETSKGWNKFVWLFGTTISFFSSKLFISLVVWPFNTSNINNAFDLLCSFKTSRLLLT